MHQTAIQLFRRLAGQIAAEPPIDRRGQVGISWFYSVGDVDRLRDRLREVVRHLPRSRIVADEQGLSATALPRRREWRRLARSAEAGDVVFVVDAVALGPIWQKVDVTFAMLGRTNFRTVLIPATNRPIELAENLTDDQLAMIRAEGLADYHRRQIDCGISGARRQGRWIGRPPLGWHCERGTIQPDAGDLATIKAACEAHENGQSLKAVAAALTAQGNRLHDGRPWTYERLRTGYRYAVATGLTPRRRRPWDVRKRRLG